jgi:hypothetical protein
MHLFYVVLFPWLVPTFSHFQQEKHQSLALLIVDTYSFIK